MSITDSPMNTPFAHQVAMHEPHSQNAFDPQAAQLPAQNTLPLLDFLADNLAKSRLHRCQLVEHLISQDQLMKLIYHYERLDDTIKAQLPLQGQLLVNFDKLLSREGFSQLAQLEIGQVAKPWQLKFVGKLVLFFEQPEIALRLQWTNTLKPFEIIENRDLIAAVNASFANWQFIGAVEVVSKSPDLTLIAPHPDLVTPWQLQACQSFVTLPSVLSHSVQQFFHDNILVNELWLPAMQETATDMAQQWLEQQALP